MGNKSTDPDKLKNPKGAIWKAIKSALLKGSKKQPDGTVYSTRTDSKKNGLGR